MARVTLLPGGLVADPSTGGEYLIPGAGVVSIAGGGGGITGTATLVDSIPTLSGSGSLGHTGTGAHADTAPTLSGSGVLGHIGSGAHTDTIPTLTGAGKLTHSGTGLLFDTIPTMVGTGGDPALISTVLRARSTSRTYSSRPKQTNGRR